MRFEAVRPLAPSATGRAESDGVGIHWETYGEGERTILLLAPWSLFDSRVWKFQVPYLAQRARVVVYDPPGNGRSDRPTERRQMDEDAEVRVRTGGRQFLTEPMSDRMLTADRSRYRLDLVMMHGGFSYE